MTLSERNTFFRAGIVFCVIITLLLIAASYLIIPVYSTIIDENLHRPANIFQIISGFFLNSNYYAVHTSLIAAVLFSLAGMIFIQSFFERTSAPEILYISFFTFSFSLEIIRLIVPLHLINNFPSAYLLIASRALLFARYFGIFSLFAAGVCAAGMEVQKTRNTVLIIAVAVFLVVLNIPIDTQTWDTSFKMINGYNATFKLIETVVFLSTSISFFIAVKVKGSADYAYVAVGVMVALIGRSILIGTDNWACILGLLLLSFGTWFTCSKLHKIHLWL